ncbi:hypothetical protein NIES2109_00160 [Nostoc sp. HK-01]|nr:hypothetical protein NIES2109_00160 [Nostoc sp. HK-01]
MQYVIQAVKLSKTALLRLTKASKLMRELWKFTPKQLLTVFIFASLIGNCRKNQHQPSDLLAIASTLKLITEKYCPNLYQQYFATVEAQP